MKKYPILGMILVALVILMACGPKTTNAEQAFKTADESFNKAAAPQRRSRLRGTS